jgi:hypothetical protein
MRKDKQERHGRLCGLIECVVAENRADGTPAIFEGQEWAVAPLPIWADWLGVSVDAITDLIKVAPQ